MTDQVSFPGPAEFREVPPGPDRLLSWVCALWLLDALTGAAVAIREDLPGELIAGVFVGRDASVEFFKGPGTALPPGLAHLAAQVTFAVLSTLGGRAGTIGTVGLTVVGAGATAGALDEKMTYKVLSPRSFDPSKAAIVSAGISLSSLMSVLGARPLFVLRRRGA